MAKGFLGGIVAGVVVCGLGFGVASLATNIPGRSAPDAGALDVPAGSAFNGARSDEPASMSSTPDAPPEKGDVPEVDTSPPDDLSSISESDMQPAAVPQTGTAEANLSAPQVGAEDSGMSIATPEPSPGAPPSAVPGAPVEDETSGTSISLDPAQPAPPSADAESAAFPEQESDAPEAATAAPDVEPAAEPETPEPEARAEPAPEATTPEPEVQAEAEAEPVEEAATPEAQPEPEAMTDAPEPEAAEKEPPAKTIGNLAENVATNRLPSVTDTPQEQETPETGLRAIEANAEPFDNPEGKPLMAIVLIDDGSSPIGIDALASFPYPLNFAVDASWDGAGEAMARYRAAGFEVLVMVDLPQGARASDTEIAMQTVLGAVPEAVAVIEGTGTGLQSDRAAAEQLAPILLETGHGLVLFPNGLDTARKLISREGVPTGSVFRDFDANGQDATVIRRFLDQAAFKAGRGQGEVIMLGRLRADTISALLLWGLQDRASSVAIAPISAVLTEAED